MRRIAMLLLGAVALTGLSAEAEADTAGVVLKAKPIAKAPPPARSYGASGFYIGINGGYDWGRAKFSGFPFFDATVDARSGMAGLTFGYNAQAGSFVYGLETGIDAAWMKTVNWAGPPCLACEIQMRYFGTLRGRIGYAVGQSLPYITGGLAYGGLSTSSLMFGTSQNDTKIGWTVGAGVEYAVLAHGR